MPNTFKLFGAKDTSSFKSRFRLSLIKLTSLYVAILALILLLSSSVIYSAFSMRLQHRYDNFRPVRTNEQRELFPELPNADDVRTDLIYSLILVNGVLLILAGSLSYALAKWTLRPLEESYEQQKKFLSDASHELRTPLSIMRVDLENEAASHGAGTEARKRAESNLEEVERMGLLVDDLLTLSRLDEDGAALRKSVVTVNLSDLAKNAAERMQKLAVQHSVDLSFESSAANVVVLANADMLSQAVTNIIKNAILYNKPGGKAQVSVKTENNKGIITVKDTGVGIAPADLEKIFDRFYRAEKSRGRAYGGSGLGLSIARSAVEHFGGTITAESESGKGTEITIILPRG